MGVYNAIGQLASRTVTSGVPASAIAMLYDQDGNLIAEANAVTGATMREYIWLAGRPVAVVKDVDTANPVISHVHVDHLDRPVLMTSAAGAVVWRAVYQPFGTVHAITGPAALDHRFPGQWFMLETGLHTNWHRWYDASLGRYTQPDPLELVDGPSRYAYAKNSPLMYTDPDGQLAFIPILLGVGIGLNADSIISEVKDRCGCSGDTAAGTVVYGALGGAIGAFGRFASKPRSSLAGGGPSKGGTSSWSELIGSALARGHLSFPERNLLRRGGRYVAKGLPFVGAGLITFDLLALLQCIQKQSRDSDG